MNTIHVDHPDLADGIAFDQSQVQFLRKMGHDLRTPLNSIIGTSELMLSGIYGELTPRQRTGTERILNNGDRLLQLIDALMTFIRASADALHLESMPIPGQLLADAVLKHTEAAQARGTTLSVTVADTLANAIHGDPDYLPRLLDELIRNGIAATSNGTISVQIADDEAADWKISVTDSGIGITPEVRANAFQPFWRGTEFKKLDPYGRGLGLPIVAELVRMMKGSLTLDNNPTGGTLVCVRLPRIMPEYQTEAMLSGVSATPPAVAVDPVNTG